MTCSKVNFDKMNYINVELYINIIHYNVIFYVKRRPLQTKREDRDVLPDTVIKVIFRHVYAANNSLLGNAFIFTIES